MKLSRKLFAILSVGITGLSCPAFGEDYHKGVYNTFYAGAARFKDINFGTEGGIRGFDPGFEFQLGIGYDYGKRYRIEGIYNKSISDFESTSSLTAYNELVATTFGINVFYDFPNESGYFTPFVGVGLGRTKLEVKGADKADDTAWNTDLIAGVAYELSDNLDFDAKYTFRFFQDTTLGLVDINGVGMHSLLAGVRFHF